jgi:hypothetical protein
VTSYNSKKNNHKYYVNIIHMSSRAVNHAFLHSAGIIIPQHHNNYRPYALRHPVLAFLTLLLVIAKVGTVAILTLTPETAFLSTITAPYLIDRVNAARRDASLPTLAPNSSLQESARHKGEDMLKNGYFAHNSPSGTTPWKWFDDVGYGYVYAGENLAIDFSTGEDVHEAWMKSPGHRRNILNEKYRDIGIAVVTGKFNDRVTTIVVQHFGSLTSNVPARETVLPASNNKITPEKVSPIPPKTTPTPLPTPEILEPTEGQILPDGAATVRGTSISGSVVQLELDGDKVGTYTAANGFFNGKFSVPMETQKDATLIASASLENQTTTSKARNVKIATREPSINTDSAIFLPDPQGDISSLLLIVPIFGTTKKATAMIDNKTIPLEITGTVATGKVEAASTTNKLTVRAEDNVGHIKTATVYPLQRFRVTPPTIEEKLAREKIDKIVKQVREISTILLYVLSLIVAINILVHVKIQHADLIAHSLFVLAMGALLFLLT